MSGYQQLKFIEICKTHFPYFFSKAAEVMEIGSADINGTIRGFFDNSKYIGIDIKAGIGVDKIYSGHDKSISRQNKFDLVISCECFEHNKYWKETFENMIRISKPGGLIILTCAGIVRGEHGTKRCSPEYSLTSQLSWGYYYKNLSQKDFETTSLLTNFEDYIFVKNIFSRDLYFVGFKKILYKIHYKNTIYCGKT